MQFGQWNYTMAYQNRKISVEIEDKALSVQFQDEKYTAIKFKLDVAGLKKRHYYRFTAALEKQDLQHRYFYNCLDENGVEKHKGHLKSGQKILIPEDCEILQLELLLIGYAPGTARLPGFELVEEGPYVSRKVRLCAVAWDMIGGQTFKTYEENVENVMKELDIVGPQKPDVVVFTEALFQTGRDSKRQPKVHFSRLDDDEVAMLCAKAKQYNTYICCSIYEMPEEDGPKRLTGILINRQGEIQETYHKTHLTMGEVENGAMLETELPVYDTDFGKVGIHICWDHFFPECSRALALRGAEILLVPTHGFRRERSMTRALENGVYLVSAYTYSQGAVVVNPNGQVIAEAEDKGYAIVEVDLNEPIWCPWLACDSTAEPNSTYLNERRPDLYGILCEPIEY